MQVIEASPEIKAKALEAYELFKAMPPGSEIGTLYDQIEPDVYNEMLNLVNFTDKDEIVKTVYKSTEEGGLALPKDSWIFDAGCGSGILSQLLQKQGYKNIDAADACEKFIAHVKEKAYYT